MAKGSWGFFLSLVIMKVCLIISCTYSPGSKAPITYLGIANNYNGYENVVIHTMDDYSNKLPQFLDYLDSFDIKSTIFVDRTHNIPDSGWKRLNKAYISGNEIGSHTRHHTFIDAPMNEKTADLLLNDIELKGSAQDILSHTSQPWVWSFAYPGGEGYQFTSIQRKVQEAGYLIARRFSGFLDIDEQWRTHPRDSFRTKIIPVSRFAFKPDDFQIENYNFEIPEFYRILQKKHCYNFVTHPKGLDYSEKSDIHNFLKFLNSFPNIWFAPLGYYAQYRIASESVKLNAIQTIPYGISLLIDNPLPDSIYKMPLTFCLKVQFEPESVIHDGNKLPCETAIPRWITQKEYYFLRDDTLFINAEPRGKIEVVLNSAQALNAGQKHKTKSIIKVKTHHLFKPDLAFDQSLTWPYSKFRGSVLRKIDALKTDNFLPEADARKITYLYCKIGELDSAFKYLEQAGDYNEAYVLLTRASVNIAHILSWQQNIAAADTVLSMPLKFKSGAGQEKLINYFAVLLYNTAFNQYDVNSALYLLRSARSPSLDNLLIQTKCFEYLLKADSTNSGANKLPEYASKVYCALGDRYCLDGRFNDAISALQRAIQLNPADPQLYNDLGVVYYKMQTFDEAINAYKKSIQTDSKFAIAHYNLALTYFKLGRFDECLAYLQQSIKLGHNKINPSMLSLLKNKKNK